MGADESLVSDLDGEHRRMADAMVAVRTAMAALASNPDAANLAGARSAFSVLSEVIETHFSHEEQTLEPMMAQVRDTPELKQAAAAIRKTMTPGQTGAYLAWLADGADPGARAFLRREIPAPVLLILTRLVGRSYRRRVSSVWA